MSAFTEGETGWHSPSRVTQVNIGSNGTNHSFVPPDRIQWKSRASRCFWRSWEPWLQGCMLPPPPVLNRLLCVRMLSRFSCVNWEQRLVCGRLCKWGDDAQEADVGQGQPSWLWGCASASGLPITPSSFLQWQMSYRCLVAQSSLTLCNPMDCSSPGSSVHGILQARTLEWAVLPSSRRSSRPRDRTQVSHVSCIGRWVLYHERHLGSPLLYMPVYIFLGWGANTL